MSNPDRIRFEYYTKNYIVFYFDKLDACEVIVGMNFLNVRKLSIDRQS
jgi:hypothetical protein